MKEKKVELTVTARVGPFEEYRPGVTGIVLGTCMVGPNKSRKVHEVMFCMNDVSNAEYDDGGPRRPRLTAPKAKHEVLWLSKGEFKLVK